MIFTNASKIKWDGHDDKTETNGIWPYDTEDETEVDFNVDVISTGKTTLTLTPMKEIIQEYISSNIYLIQKIFILTF